jgi:hypothetical protein
MLPSRAPHIRKLANGDCIRSSERDCGQSVVASLTYTTAVDMSDGKPVKTTLKRREGFKFVGADCTPFATG